MQNWQVDLLDRLNNLHDRHGLISELGIATRNLGFDYCAYGMRLPYPLSSPETFMLNNYPEAWQLHYQQMNYLASDPTVLHALKYESAVVWSDIFAEAPLFWEDAKAFGLAVGWARPCRGKHGVLSMLTLARGAEPLSASELNLKETKLNWLAQASHEAMIRQVLPELLPEMKAGLTDREIEILRWSADGKSSGQISDILLISENTVNFHMKNSISKLRASNKTGAVVKAALLGILK